MVALIRTIGMRDLRDRRVFARLLYAVTLHEVDRLMHSMFNLFIGRPVDQWRHFFKDLAARRGAIDIVLSAGMVLATLLRAYALLFLSIATLVLAFSRT
jgi:DNA-binding transcriptional regulator YbjK